jgi:GNAT superfamily N-acetyltransferase
MTNAMRDPANRDHAPAGADGIAGPMAVTVTPEPMSRRPLDPERRMKEVAGSASLDVPCPHDPCHCLAFPVAHPDPQNRGIGSALSDRHHARLDRAGLSRHLEANDHRYRDLHLRHGYARRSVNQVPGGSPLWSKRRSPMA